MIAIGIGNYIGHSSNHYCRQRYYVSNTGDDSKDGLTESTAWQTINKVNNSTFFPLDHILFKKGDIWRETLTVPSSGSNGHNIKFSSYGTGVNPIITGSNILTGWTSEVVEVTPAIPEYTGNIAAETFNAAGYDLGANWTETVGAGSVVDEDNTDIADSAGGNSQILKIQKVSPNFNAKTRWRGSAQAISYFQCMVKITAEGLSAGNSVNIAYCNGTDFNAPWNLYIKKGTVVNWRFDVYNNGANVSYTSTSEVVLNTWYKIEVRYDVTNSAYEFRVDGTTKTSGVLTGTLRANPRDFFLGDGDFSKTLTAYYDNMYISNAGYVGPAVPAVNITTYKKVTDVKPNIIYQNNSRLLENLVSKASLLVGQFWWDAGNTLVYVRTTGDDNVSGYTMEVGYRTKAVDINDMSYITLDGLTIRSGNNVLSECLTIGGVSTIGIIVKNSTIDRGAKYGIHIGGSTDPTSFVIDNCIIKDNGDSGILVDHRFTNGRISNNQVYNNGIDTVRDNAEGSGIEGVLADIDIYGNNVYGNGPSPANSPYQSHGIYNTVESLGILKIHDNLLHDHVNGEGLKVLGVSANVYRNKIYDNYNEGSAITANGSKNVVVRYYNNLIYGNNKIGGGNGGISITTKGAGTMDIEILNNTFYKNADTGSGPAEINVKTDLTSLKIKNNILFGSNSKRTLSIEVAQTGNLDIDNNCHWKSDESGAPNIRLVDTYPTFAEWQALGHDVHGINVDPKLTNPTSDLTVQSDSQCVGAGVDVGLGETNPNIGAL